MFDITTVEDCVWWQQCGVTNRRNVQRQQRRQQDEDSQDKTAKTKTAKTKTAKMKMVKEVEVLNSHDHSLGLSLMRSRSNPIVTSHLLNSVKVE